MWYCTSRQGKIHHIGLCEVSPTTLRRAHAVHPQIACVQMEYSAFSTEIEDPFHAGSSSNSSSSTESLLQTCRDLGVAIVAYSPLSRGILTGTITMPSDHFGAADYRREYPRFAAENFEKNLELVGIFKTLAEKKTRSGGGGKIVTAGQVALAWLLAQGDDVFPIPGYVMLLPLFPSTFLSCLVLHVNL